MSVSVSVMSFNIYGTKNKNLIIDELYNKFDIVCLQEYLLTGTSVYFLSCSANHFTFPANATSTSGRPSGELTCIIRKSSAFYLRHDIFLMSIF